MIINYFILALRNLLRQKGYTFLSFAGLSTALTICAIIIVHLQIETGFDSFVPDHDRIYRVIRGNNDSFVAPLSPPLAQSMESSLPDIVQTVRTAPGGNALFSCQRNDGSLHYQMAESGYFVDSTFLEFFGVPVLSGSISQSLRTPGTIVLTESYAERLFGAEDPVGKTVYTGRGTSKTVTAVIRDVPFNSHMQYVFLRPMVEFENYFQENHPGFWDNRSWSQLFTYVKLQEHSRLNELQLQLDQLKYSYYDGVFTEEELQDKNLVLQPLSDIHLQSNLIGDEGSRSNIVYLHIFAVVGAVLLLMAGTNFINLSLAFALTRAKEIGIRKLIGANRSHVFTQILFETGCMVVLATVGMILLLLLFAPVYFHLSGFPSDIGFFTSTTNVSYLAATLLILFILGGVYPALFVSGFNPRMSLSGNRHPKSVLESIRKSLVVFQFIITAFVLFSTLVILHQVDYLQNKDLGFETDYLVAYEFFGDLHQDIVNNLETVKAELKQDPHVLSVSGCSALPGNHFSGEGLYTERTPEGEYPWLRVLRADRDIVETLGLEIVQGQSFANLPPDRPAFLINETAMQRHNLPEPVGMHAWNNTWGEYEGEIAGVVRDFNFESLHNTIDPISIELKPQNLRFLVVRIDVGSIPATLNFIENTFRSRQTGGKFEFQFVDDRIESLYRSEQRMAYLFRAFAIVCVFISGLGLFGMASLAIKRRIREFSIRKVLGATVAGLYSRESIHFVKWILLADAIAIPLSVYAMNKWLANFAYHVDLQVWMGFVIVVATLGVALLAVSFHTVRAAMVNPVDILRNE